MTRVIECTVCGRRSFYDKRRCLDCGSEAFEQVSAGTGELLAVTSVDVTPNGVREPNRLGIAAFDGDANVVAQIDDGAADLDVGDAVRLEGDHDLRQAEDGPIVGSRLVAEE